MNHKFITSLTPKSKTYKKGLGEGLFIVVDKVYQGKSRGKLGGRKYFKGRVKGQEIWVGVFGNKSGQLTLKNARAKFSEIKDYCHKNECTIRDYKREKHRAKVETWTLQDAINNFLKDKKELIKTTSFIEYDRKLKQVLTLIDGSTPLKELEWDEGGELIEDVISKIENGGKGNNVDLARRCRNLLKQVFNKAISKKKMRRGQNPALLDSDLAVYQHRISHHPHLEWKEVPEFLEKVSINFSNSHPFSQMATKLTLLTFLRSGALTRLEWNWITKKDGIECIEIPPETSGLKRKKGKNDDIPHYVPITPQIQKILNRMKRFNNGEKYIFPPMKDSRFAHLDPSAPNNFIRNLGYKDKLRAHGWRSVALTNGIDLLKTPREVIKKQMGHLPNNKVDQAYDKSLMLEERKVFLEKWCDLLEKNGLEVY